MKKICDICDKEFEGHGLAKRCSDKCKKAYQKEWHKSEKRKAYLKAYNKSEKGMASKEAWAKSDVGKAYHRAYQKEWKKSEKYKAYQKAYQKAYYSRLNLANSKISQRTLAAWSLQVKERDNHTCQVCDSTEHLHAHHIQPKSIFPELALDLDNGMTLCKGCHIEVHLVGTEL